MTPAQLYAVDLVRISFHSAAFMILFCRLYPCAFVVIQATPILLYTTDAHWLA